MFSLVYKTATFLTVCLPMTHGLQFLHILLLVQPCFSWYLKLHLFYHCSAMDVFLNILDSLICSEEAEKYAMSWISGMVDFIGRFYSILSCIFQDLLQQAIVK